MPGELRMPSSQEPKRRRKRGRPALQPDQRKRNNVTLRLRDSTKAQLQHCAQAEGRSLSEEIESRLEGSFQTERSTYEEFGGELQYILCRNFAGLARVVAEAREARAGNGPATWIDDPQIFYMALGLWEAGMDVWFAEKGDDPTKEWTGALTERPRKEVYREMGKYFEKAHKSVLPPHQNNGDVEDA